MKKRTSLFAKCFFSKPSIWLFAWIGRVFVTILLKTLRITVHNKEELQKLIKAINSNPASATPVAIALWHNKLLLTPLLRTWAPIQSCVSVVSGSRDGKLLSEFIKTYRDAGVIVATSKNRHNALIEMVDALKKRTILFVTPDGPRGPRQEVKMGVIYSAMKSEAVIVPIAWHASHMLELSTWDKFCIPYPFSKVTFTIESPIFCKEDDNAQELAKLLASSL